MEAPDRESDYDNLLYACMKCNVCKGEAWPVPDPCATAYGEHLRVLDDGRITGLTQEGRRLIRVLRLDRKSLTDFRAQWLELWRIAQANPDSRTAAFGRDLMRFPDDLPDLAALHPPGGNKRPHGVQASYFARRESLPAGS